jgi:glutamine synthetase
MCIEADTAIEITSTMILPAVLRYKSMLLTSATTKLQKKMLEELDFWIDATVEALSWLKKKMNVVPKTQEKPEHYGDSVLSAMETLRYAVDNLETMVDDDLWPMPTYTEMLFAR